MKSTLSQIGYIIAILWVLSSCQHHDEVGPELKDCGHASQLWNIETYEIPRLPALRDVFFSSQDVGYAVGNAGTIIKTRDGGETWEVINKYDFIEPITELMLTAVHFINDETGFIGSEEKGCCFGDELNLGAVFLKTYNGGNTWTKKYFPDINEFYEIIFFDELTGLALCSVKENDNSIRKILKTEDGGQNWNPVAIQGIKSIATYKLNARPDLFPVVAIDKDDQEVLLISIDNGISWQIKDLPAQECNRIYFFNENVGFASCGLLFFPEYVYETVDGGTNWKFVPGNPFNFSSVVHFYSEKEGLIINGHYHYEVSHGEGWDILDYYDVYETEDGGQEWSITSVLRDCDFEGNYFMRDKNHFCLLGTDFIKFEIK